MCIEYHTQVNMYHVSAQGVDKRMINVHYYYYYYDTEILKSGSFTDRQIHLTGEVMSTADGLASTL